MKRGLFQFLHLVVLSVVLSGCTNPASDRPNGTERAMFSTYPLFSKKIVGTCFFVAVRDPYNRNCFFPVVVTSKHLLKIAGKDPLFIPLRVIGGDGSFEIVPVRMGNGKRQRPWFVCHPDFDVAAFPLLLPENLDARCALMLIEERNFVRGTPRVGTEVSFLGFPEGMSGTPDLFPVLRAGRVASYDPGECAPRLFLVNGDVFPGDSGSPLLLSPGKSNPRLAGMVVQRVEVADGERSPIAVAVEAGVILETLELLADQDRDR